MNAYTSQWPHSSAANEVGIPGELTIEAPFSGPQHKGRRAERVPIELGAGLRQRGAAGVSVQIMDLSTDGFRVATHLTLEKGTDVWLRLPGLEPAHARVVWAEGHFVGCVFERALHPAVLQMIIAKSGNH